MHALTKEWVEKADGDFNTACRENRVRKTPNYDAVCFHCQQCVEKYAVEFRYPGELATKDDARITMQAMKVMRTFVRERLGLPS